MHLDSSLFIHHNLLFQSSTETVGVSAAMSSTGLDVTAVAVAMTGRAAYGLISSVDMFLPAIALGATWIAVFRALDRASSGGRTEASG